ncbi:MAG: carboxymuconolactone decarboxylase family protein [Acidobacteria bacterium]|nr:carboxymuconolactone decarboxylase family protein [Acidobacteriota bacterium]
MSTRAVLTIILSLAFAAATEQRVFGQQDRMPRIPAEQMTAEQKQAVTDFMRLRNTTTLNGSFATLLRSPELMIRTSAIGEYVRRSVLPAPLYEFVVLITARQFDQQYVWDAHYKPAQALGMSQTLLDELTAGKTPTALTDDQRMLWTMLDELHRTNRVSDATYARTLARFGEQGVIDAVATSGYYAMLGMVMNTAQTKGTGDAPKLQPRGR